MPPVEAASVGTAVVASRLDPHVENLDHQVGLFERDESAGSIAARLLDYLHYQDDADRAVMQGYVLGRFEWDSLIAHQLLPVYLRRSFGMLLKSLRDAQGGPLSPTNARSVVEAHQHYVSAYPASFYQSLLYLVDTYPIIDARIWSPARDLILQACEMLIINFRHTGARNALARFLGEQNFLKLARQAYEDVLRIDARNTEALKGLAHLSITEGKTDEALRFYGHVLAIDPQDAEAA